MPPEFSPEIELFDNPHPDIVYEIQMECPEFTCLCPRTSQPDFATLRITYAPYRTCMELKSFKQYLWSYRDKGIYHEDVTNQILKDLVSLLKPLYLDIEGEFFIRGGIRTTVRASYTPGEEDV